MGEIGEGRTGVDAAARVRLTTGDRDWAVEMKARPHIFGHNIETVEWVTLLVRSISDR